MSGGFKATSEEVFKSSDTGRNFRTDRVKNAKKPLQNFCRKREKKYVKRTGRGKASGNQVLMGSPVGSKKGGSGVRRFGSAGGGGGAPGDGSLGSAEEAIVHKDVVKITGRQESEDRTSTREGAVKLEKNSGERSPAKKTTEES